MVDRDMLRAQFALAHSILDMVTAEITDAVANSVPSGKIEPIAKIWAHAVTDEDFMLNAIMQEKPLLFATGGWAERTGIPEPQGPLMTPEWLDGLTVNLEGLREYAKVVYAQTDAVLANGSEEMFAREVNGPVGKAPAIRTFATIGLYHLSEHTGEIAALKGVQDLQGLPF